MSALDLQAKISLDGSGFHRGLESAADSLKGFIAGAVGIGTIDAAFEKTIESAEELVNTSRKLDMTVEQLQIIRQAAEESGVGFDTMRTALERFNAIRENILNGGKGSAAQMEAMQRLGVSKSDLQNKTAAENMMGGISSTARNSNAADIANDLKQVFGKGGQELFGTLKTDFDELGAHMKGMGAIMDTTTAHELKQFKDQMGMLGRVITANIAPIIVGLGKALFQVTAALGAFGTALGYQIAKLAELLRHPIRTLEHPADFLKDATKGMAETVDEYWKDKQTEYENIFSPKEESVKPMDVSREVPDLIKDKPDKLGALPRNRIGSDSLVSVGNFLGQGTGSTVVQIAQKHLKEAEKHTELLTRIGEAMKKTAGDMGLPSFT